MIMSFGDVVVEFLLFPERVGRLTAFEMDGHPIGTELVEKGFLPTIQDRARLHRLDDLETLVHGIRINHSSLIDWYAACLSAWNIRLHFEDRMPFIGQEGFKRWRRLTSRIDPDAFITLQFVRQFLRVPARDELLNWGVYATTGDRDLRRLFNDGINDIHTHLEGCECVPVLWTDLMARRSTLERLREYNERRRRELSVVPGQLARIDAEIRAIHIARLAWEKLATRFDGWVPPLSDDDAGHNSPVSRMLWEERRVLCESWHVLDTEAKGSDEVAVNLDCYLFAKSLFLRRHHQFPGGNPGLTNFRKHFDRVRSGTPISSARKEWKRTSRMLYFCTESRNLAAVELRMSPMDTVAQYGRFFLQWERKIAADKFLSKRSRLYSFVIHFIRSIDSIADDPVHSGHSFGQLRRTLDRQSAALHLFRLNNYKLARHIVGIDVANKERHCPVDVFSPYLRLLRATDMGEEDWRGNLDSPYLVHWNDLLQRRRHIDARAPHLGLTYHAGEDFFHPLDGMRAIWHAIHFAGMKVGDRIGHGLAAGVDIAEFNRMYDNTILMPQCEALDGLVWLHARLCELQGLRDNVLSRVTDEIDRLCFRVYGEIYEPRLLDEVQAMRHKPPFWHRIKTVDRRIASLIEKETRSHYCRTARREAINIPPVLIEATAAVTSAQKLLVDVAARKGIVFEINPSSNLATGALDGLDKHPFFTIQNHNNALKLTINCDDPGTFATRLENEYALFLGAIVDRGIDREAALRLIDAMRDCALVSGFRGSLKRAY